MENKLSLEWLSINRALQFYSQLLIHLWFAKHSKWLVLYFSEFPCDSVTSVKPGVLVSRLLRGWLAPTGQVMFYFWWSRQVPLLVSMTYSSKFCHFSTGIGMVLLGRSVHFPVCFKKSHRPALLCSAEEFCSQFCSSLWFHVTWFNCHCTTYHHL